MSALNLVEDRGAAANDNSLNTGDLRGIFDGSFTNWSQVGGADMPIRIIGRDDRSGTRDTFYRTVIRDDPKKMLDRSSSDCKTRDDGSTTKPVLCAFSSTEQVLDEVNSVDATVDEVRNGHYPFWAVEYLPTHGSPAEGSLQANFRKFLVHSETAKQILRNDRLYPCFDDQQDRIDLCNPAR